MRPRYSGGSSHDTGNARAQQTLESERNPGKSDNLFGEVRRRSVSHCNGGRHEPPKTKPTEFWRRPMFRSMTTLAVIALTSAFAAAQPPATKAPVKQLPELKT